VERYNKSVAVFVNAEEPQTRKTLLDTLHSIKQAEKNLQSWCRNPARGKPYTQLRQELMAEGLLDA
jgi:hypothetical protein